ncbi:chorismate-binding protein [Shigella boydii]
MSTAVIAIRSISPSVLMRPILAINGRRFLQLNQANRAPFSAFLRLEHGAILSLSPERFPLCDNSEIQTRPIKGTLPRLPNPQEDSKQAEKLANSAKNRAKI